MTIAPATDVFAKCMTILNYGLCALHLINARRNPLFRFGNRLKVPSNAISSRSRQKEQPDQADGAALTARNRSRYSAFSPAIKTSIAMYVVPNTPISKASRSAGINVGE